MKTCPTCEGKKVEDLNKCVGGFCQLIDRPHSVCFVRYSLGEKISEEIKQKQKDRITRIKAFAKEINVFVEQKEKLTKPSERIDEIVKDICSSEGMHMPCGAVHFTSAIIQYLDEQWEQENKK